MIRRIPHMSNWENAPVVYPHIIKAEGDVARLKENPRIKISMLVESYDIHGRSVDEVCRQYPHLTPAEVHTAMGYYYDHQDEIDAEMRANRDLEIRVLKDVEANPSPLVERMRALKALREEEMGRSA